MEKQMMNLELPLFSLDWGEANLNPCVRAFGLKKDRRAKCKSCVFLNNHKEILCCSYRLKIDHSPDFRACTNYQNKRRVKVHGKL